MATAREMLERLEFLERNMTDVVSAEVGRHAQELESLNREQLMRGESASGKLLDPISQDPYFKGNAAAAKAYADWKHKITPLTPYDRPNLFINGYTHSKIEAIVKNNQLVFQAPGLPWGKELDVKYEEQAFGLNEASRETAWSKFLKRGIVTNISILSGIRKG